MFLHYCENFLFKPFKIQCLFIFLLVFFISIWPGFELIRREKNQILQKMLACKNLEKIHREEKKENYLASNVKKNIPNYAQAVRLLNTPKIYDEASFLMNEIAGLTLKENLHLNHIELRNEIREKMPNSFHLLLKLQGSYQAMTEFCLVLTKQPYLVELEKFSIQAFNKERGGSVLYAEFSIKIYTVA